MIGINFPGYEKHKELHLVTIEMSRDIVIDNHTHKIPKYVVYDTVLYNNKLDAEERVAFLNRNLPKLKFAVVSMRSDKADV